MDNKPSPGSPKARLEGCCCPVMDNNHGRGAYIDSNGKPVYWYNLDCPIHGEAESIDPKTLLFENKR